MNLFQTHYNHHHLDRSLDGNTPSETSGNPVTSAVLVFTDSGGKSIAADFISAADGGVTNDLPPAGFDLFFKQQTR